jgi:hypothetical protein
MLCEAFRRLSKFGAVEHYQYVGFGAIWFADFSLIHRSLGISKMFCIERELGHRHRFEFNRPFGGVELMFGNSAQELPKIDWRNRSIVWLDYDDQLNPSILADVRNVAGSASSGTMLIVSVQAQTRPILRMGDDDAQTEVTTVEQFRSVFGPGRTPTEMTEGDLIGWKMARLYRRVILEEISDGLSAVNAGRGHGQRLKFKSVVSIEYADGAKMTTIGGVFVDEGQEPIYNSCDFERLAFFRGGLDALRLEVPKLTPKEMREIERVLPHEDLETLQIDHLPASDVRAFASLYRYLPSFVSFEP